MRARFKAPLVWLMATGLGLCSLSLANAETGSDTAKAPVSGCVDAGSLSRKMVVDKETVLIEDGAGRAALLKLSAPCQNLDDLDMIGFEFNGSTQVCGRRDVKILYSRFNERPIRCLIQSFTPLSRDEAVKY